MCDTDEIRSRSESACSSDFDDIELFPLTDVDFNNTNNLSMQEDKGENDNVEHEFKPLMSLRQRRHSRLFTEATPLTKLKLNLNNRNNDTTNKNIIENGPVKQSTWESPRIKGLWKRALKEARSIEDPWEKFHIDELATENVIRHRYSALRKKWVLDECQVKMEKEAFNHGAMRACYRLKKLSSFSNKTNWHHAMNYVAKRYSEDVDRQVYFEDVKLQMDAKLWGEEYNRHNPPKKVDIFQMCILEFKDRPGKPLYHLEHFIEGVYIKYNSNSGFVEEHLRHTPHAFSHFTFERSRHQMIVVDIQGVGDLWTDPQIHTSDGAGYGDGNLGTRGMALFFHSHICNSICQSLGLSKFDLSDSEQRLQEQFIKSTQSPAGSVTVAKGKEEMCVSASPMESSDLVSFLASRSRTTSTCSQISEATSEMSSTSDEQDSLRNGSSIDDFDSMMMSPETPGSPAPAPHRRSRVRFISECDSSESSPLSAMGSSTLTDEEARFNFTRQAPRPSCINAEIRMLGLNNVGIGDSILGQVHHDLAKYHELGRFSVDDNDIDLESAFYHEQQAAALGVMEAIKTMAHIYLGMPREILVNYEVENSDSNSTKGIDYMYMAAKAGCRSAMIHMAKAYETGIGLSSDREVDWGESVSWYQKAIDTEGEDDSGEYDGMLEMPVYQMTAKIADMYLSGGPMLDPDPSYAGEMYTNAADAAMAAMKGRMANKYYALAEEAWAQVEE